MKTFFKYRLGQRWTIAAALLMSVALVSCKRDMIKPELISNQEANSFADVFETFWQGLNSQYLFWDAETVNWDSMYHVYKPRFDSLDRVPYSDTAMNRCFQYMADMTKDLKDGQYALALWEGGDYHFEDSLYKSYISFIPRLMRAQKIHAALPDTLFDYIIQYNYLKEFDYGVYRNYDNGQIFQVITGKLSKGSKNVQYMNINNFMMKESYDAPYPSRPTRPVIKNFFDKVRKSACDAVIIDLRNNRGGNLEDLDFLVGQFTSKPALFGYARYKLGSGRLDYTPALPMNITPQKDANDFKKPIVILTDIYSAALCETVIQAFKALPEAQVTIVGEQTYGTSGFLAGTDISTNGGGFSVSRFASVRLSNAAFLNKNHQFNFSGIAPDIEIKYDAARINQMLQTGIDIQLEKAIQFINK